MSLFDALGFHWDRCAVPAAIPVYTVERTCFHFQRMLAEFVWDAGVLEGNPVTFVEVKTLLDGVTVGGRKIADQEQILNLAESSRYLLRLVRSGNFVLNKTTFTGLHQLVARNEALEWGHFRGEGAEWHYTPDVGLGEHGRHTPLPAVKGGANLDEMFRRGVDALNEVVPNAFEKGAAFFLFGTLQQFFFDGNKRASRSMMNGVLMSAGMDAISIPAGKAQEFNEKMVRFYRYHDASEMMQFLLDCHPEAQRIRELKSAQ